MCPVATQLHAAWLVTTDTAAQSTTGAIRYQKSDADNLHTHENQNARTCLRPGNGCNPAAQNATIDFDVQPTPYTLTMQATTPTFVAQKVNLLRVKQTSTMPCSDKTTRVMLLTLRLALNTDARHGQTCHDAAFVCTTRQHALRPSCACTSPY